MSTNSGELTSQDFKKTFLEIQPQLKSYLFRILANQQDAEDLAQDTYVKADHNLDTFDNKASLKTWVFAIATNLARDKLRTQRRWGEDIQDRCRTSTQASPEKVAHMRNLVNNSPADQYDFREHLDYCFTCIGKTLTTEQQQTLILKEVYGFKISDIIVIMNLSEGKVKYALSQARRTMQDIYDRRCTLINKTGVCYQCSEMNDFVRSEQDSDRRRQQLELVREAQNGASPDRLLDLRLALVRSVNPLELPAFKIHDYLLSLMPEHAE